MASSDVLETDQPGYRVSEFLILPQQPENLALDVSLRTQTPYDEPRN
ncbi:MAG: hypothetical protein RMI43_03625 [Candidatus Caldarchaeum sp.]|nr:hypothetical protein [Candidatus Caldarchaeum sp.]MDW8063241.1 hypothetical protein [Candidatus Caldarchaeum sp.]MDW8435566.1 hypothetical protein [Candidatus Caldarchaeum sp.]